MKRLKRILLLVSFVLIAVTSYAQGPGFEGDIEDVPIDGGVSLLAAAAIAYGAKRIKGTLNKD